MMVMLLNLRWGGGRAEDGADGVGNDGGGG